MTLAEWMKQIEERLDKATPGPWFRCHHLKDKEGDKSCPCGFPGDIWGPDHEHVVCTMGPHLHVGEGNLVPPRYDRDTEFANAQLIVNAPTDLATALKVIKTLIEALADAVYDLNLVASGSKCSACSCSCHQHANDALAKLDERLRSGE